MSNLKNNTMLQFTTKINARKETGFDYLGDVNHSAKTEKGTKFEMLTYSIFLAPAKMSGHEVCPGRNDECTALCLNESGRNRMNGSYNETRIKKTKLFYENREFFVRWVIAEINTFRNRAKKRGMSFSVRLNNTSDLSPETFYIIDNGIKKNILEIFPDVQFYDYTKVVPRVKLLEKYPNYDLTFSYSGTNLSDCLTMLNNGVRVAMVFDKVPTSYMGFDVVNGDNYDFRFVDKKNVIVGLKFKPVRNKLITSNFVIK